MWPARDACSEVSGGGDGANRTAELSRVDGSTRARGGCGRADSGSPSRHAETRARPAASAPSAVAAKHCAPAQRQPRKGVPRGAFLWRANRRTTTPAPGAASDTTCCRISSQRVGEMGRTASLHGCMAALCTEGMLVPSAVSASRTHFARPRPTTSLDNAQPRPQLEERISPSVPASTRGAPLAVCS